MSDLIQVAGDLMPCRSCQAPFFIGGSWPPGWTVEVHREGNRTLLTPHREDCGRPTAPPEAACFPQIALQGQELTDG